MYVGALATKFPDIPILLQPIHAAASALISSGHRIIYYNILYAMYYNFSLVRAAHPSYLFRSKPNKCAGEF